MAADPSELLALNGEIDDRRDELASLLTRRGRMVIALIDAGLPRERIAKACGVPSATVYGWMRDVGRHTVRVPRAKAAGG